MRLALGLAYDGTSFQGYQTQPGGHTVQDHLERAVSAFLECPLEAVDTTAAGRTDAGVHAEGQVVHLDTSVERPEWNWVRGLNSFLPSEIRVRWAAPVPNDFHARFSALARSYRYQIWNEPVDHPLQQRFATWVFQPLDLNALQQASLALLGEHDFSAFRAAECQAASPVRVLTQCHWAQRGPLLTFTIKGNAFLHHMVRNIVGTLVEVGRGARPVEWVSEVLASQDRTRAGRTFPAQGLCLTEVEYPEPFVGTRVTGDTR
ncbi:MAG: hypothetical protein RL320_1594 [Pseudomonadota bacterium]|jgi:tRNA pseudouridine38-40 synthase